MQVGRYRILSGYYKKYKYLVVLPDGGYKFGDLDVQYDLGLTPKYYERITFNNYISLCTNR